MTQAKPYTPAPKLHTDVQCSNCMVLSGKGCIDLLSRPVKTHKERSQLYALFCKLADTEAKIHLHEIYKQELVKQVRSMFRE